MDESVRRRTLSVRDGDAPTIRSEGGLMRVSNQAYVVIYAVCALFSVASTRAQDFGAAASPENTVNCAAPNYGCARSDLIKTNNLNPPPSVGKGKNALVTPSDFKLPVVRVTDGNTFGKETFLPLPAVRTETTSSTRMTLISSWSTTTARDIRFRLILQPCRFLTQPRGILGQTRYAGVEVPLSAGQPGHNVGGAKTQFYCRR